MRNLVIATLLATGWAMVLSGCAGFTPPASSTDPEALARIQAALSAPDRLDWDKPFDESRKPLEYMTFFQLQSGMYVLDLGAAAGYTTEILAAAVGPVFDDAIYRETDRILIRAIKDDAS